MNSEYELELLRAFAATKPYEFKGFELRYKQAHPEPEEPVVLAEPVAVAVEYKEPEPEAVKPKTTKKKAAAEDAGA